MKVLLGILGVAAFTCWNLCERETRNKIIDRASQIWRVLQ